MLNHDLTKHLDDALHFTIADQSLRVGIMRGPDDLILAAMLIEGILTQEEARWLGDRIKEDILTWVRTGLPEAGDGVVSTEVTAMESTWRLAVYTLHNTLSDASLVSTFLSQYADRTAIPSAAPQVH